jgi:hypothetical protein
VAQALAAELSRSFSSNAAPRRRTAGVASGSERPHTAKEAVSGEWKTGNRKQETENWPMGLASALTGFEFPVSGFSFPFGRPENLTHS